TIIGTMKINTLAVVTALGAAVLSAGGFAPTLAPGAPASPRNEGRVGPDEWEAIATRFGGTKADTKPSRDSLMAFTVSAQVKEVPVQGGQVVKKDDLLVRARDDDQVAIVEGQRIQAASENEIRAAELAVELAKLKYDRLKEAGSYSP